MLHEIAPKRVAAAADRLIPPAVPARPRAAAVIDGVLSGRAWADDAQDPSAVLCIEDADGYDDTLSVDDGGRPRVVACPS